MGSMTYFFLHIGRRGAARWSHRQSCWVEMTNRVDALGLARPTYSTADLAFFFAVRDAR